MFEIIESTGLHRRTVIATLPTFEEAKAKVETMGVAFMEDDEDYPGCADVLLNDARLLAIQPVGFKITA